ncbi:beta-ketoacyl-ACP synthase III [Lachnospiraceae bacterium HCP1S3_C3]
MCVKILGTGKSLPDKCLTNDDIAKIVDTSDEWIKSRVGIETRHIAENETTTSMAADAAKKALIRAKVNAGDIELLIVASVTGDNAVPATACQVQDIIGATNAMAFDINSACAGFDVALNTVIAYFGAGIYKTALIIGAETLSGIVDWEDRSTCVLFGDGAGAAVVQYSEDGLADFIQGADGGRGAALNKPNAPVKNPFKKGTDKETGLYMDGQAVFKFAVKTVPQCIEELLKKNNLEKDDIKYYIIHQANKRIIQSVAKRMCESEDKFPSNVSKYGNTSGASIPILLDEMNENKMLNPGDKIILCGFGGGLSWGATLIKW